MKKRYVIASGCAVVLFLGVFKKLFTTDVAGLIQQFATPIVQKEINKDNPYLSSIGSVRTWRGPSEQEKSFLGARMPFVVAAQKKYFEDPTISQKDAIRIGIVFSGGGTRAMTLSLGYATGLQELGLLSSAMYMSTLSGSTWFLNSWILSGNTLKEHHDMLEEKIRTGNFSITSKKNWQSNNEVRRFFENVVVPKFAFNQPISSVDIYGGLLTNAFLPSDTTRYQKTLTDEWARIRTGARPFPISTSVSMHKFGQDTYQYNWYEFNPVDVINLELDLAVDPFAFGRAFDSGKSMDVGPEQKIGSLMGTFGSAFTVNLKDLNRIFADMFATTQGDSIKDKITKQAGAAILDGLANEPKVGPKRFSPAQYNNPWYNLPATFTATQRQPWLMEKKVLTFVDAGIDFNLPLPPLLKPERALDLIMMFDSTVDQGATGELDKTLAYARKKGYDYQPISELMEPSNQIFKAYQDKSTQNGPMILVVQHAKDTHLFNKAKTDQHLRRIIDQYNLDNFENNLCYSGGYCDTFNFEYTIEQFNQLFGVGYFNVVANQGILKHALEHVLSIKRKSVGVTPAPIVEPGQEFFGFGG